MRAVRRTLAGLAGGLLLALAGCAPDGVMNEPPPPAATPGPAAAPAVPRPDHVVVVLLENEHRSGIVGNPDAPYLNELARRGANLTHSYGVTHPSQPNYLALFSGSTQGVTDDSCPHDFGARPNLARQLLDAGLGFVGYSESLPAAGYTGCRAGEYRRKHNPWVNFSALPASVNQPFSAFPRDYATLPEVSFVVPNMCHDMHDCSVAAGDAWVRQQLSGYADWAATHNSLLVVTFDENDGGSAEPIATLLVGPMVRAGSTPEVANHYSLLRTLEDAYGLPPLGGAAEVSPLQSVWTSSPPSPPVSVVNGSFELGLAGWAAAGRATTTRSSRHGGSWVARVGASGASRGDSVVSQTVLAPAGSSRLRLAWRGRCHDRVSRASATVVVRRNTSRRSTTLLRPTCRESGWAELSTPVTPGHSYTVRLVNHDDGVAATPNRTYVDDVRFT